jgi:polar amino acid transport system substrate-binding protein
MKFTSVFKSFAALGIFLFGSLMSPVGEASTPKLRIAVDPTYPPMEFEDDKGAVQGFDIDLARDLARRVGREPEFVVMKWDGILAGLKSGRYDIIMSSMNVTPERSKEVDFVEYFQMAQVIVAKGAASKTPVNEKDLVGKTVAVQADTTSHSLVDDLKKKGIAIGDIKAFSNATDCFAALKSGQADRIVIDEPVGRFYAKKDPKTFAVIGQALAPEPVGIAVKKSDTALKTALTQALKDSRKDGSFARFSVNWFGAELGN